MVDRYTKAVLTIIAASLAVLAAQEANKTASAQLGHCGDNSFNACYVQTGPLDTLSVTVKR
jgi:hypothetical protein